jgi:hypothetical protein
MDLGLTRGTPHEQCPAPGLAKLMIELHHKPLRLLYGQFSQ